MTSALRKFAIERDVSQQDAYQKALVLKNLENLIPRFARRFGAGGYLSRRAHKTDAARSRRLHLEQF